MFAINIDPLSRISCDVTIGVGVGREDCINESKLDMPVHANEVISRAGT